MLISRDTCISKYRSGPGPSQKKKKGIKDSDCRPKNLKEFHFQLQAWDPNVLFPVKCLFQKCLHLWFFLVATLRFIFSLLWRSGCMGFWVGQLLIFLLLSSEMVKCLPNAKPAPQTQLVCSKTGGIESCFLSCPSNTLFVPGLYKIPVLWSDIVL